MLDINFDNLDILIKDHGGVVDIRDWNRIKSALEAQKTPTNNGSTCASQIAAEIESAVISINTYSPSGLVALMEKWARQLRTCR